ncbi:hypothetical protein [Serratia plymuthica]|uniref:hypothetical protein n=1 Tax=Serratia plymuthica TaxID=82996 RepID=UPI001419793F|nr:hypothetical protein [Serratia plymuthica]NIC26444.1 hypothetical protein [Serratia plymuthica]QPS88821.1 hypothetical protein I6G46_07615 [Serratia plymuthica]
MPLMAENKKHSGISIFIGVTEKRIPLPARPKSETGPGDIIIGIADRLPVENVGSAHLVRFFATQVPEGRYSDLPH